MNDSSSSSSPTLKQRLGGWLRGIRQRKLQFLLAFVFMGVLTGLCTHLGENYPFSPFPMYGNPKPDDVDYFFLTDATGNPLSTQDYAGMTSPQIKKRMNSSIESLRDALDGDKVAESRLTEPLKAVLAQLREGKFPKPQSSHPKRLDPALLAEIAKVELTKMRTDAAMKTPALIQWPAGVQLHLGLIETTERGFREQFRKVTELPDAGPPTTGEHVAKPPGSSAEGMISTMKDFGGKYGILLGALILVVVASRALPMKARAWLLDGSNGWNIGRLEAFCLRAGLAYVMWQSLQVRVEYSALPKPAGLAYFDVFRNQVLWFGTPEHWSTMLSWILPMLIWYVLGFGAVIPLTVITLAQFLGRSLYASQGAPHHGHQLIGLVFFAQMLVAWVVLGGRILKWLGKKQGPSAWPEWLRLGNWSVVWLYIASTIGAAYFITVVTKLDESDGKWLKNAHYFSNQIVKTHRQNYYNDLNPVYLEGVAPVSQDQADPAHDRYRHNIPAQADWMLKHPFLAKIFFSLGFLMEATALFLIFSRSLAAIYGILIIAFHLLVLWLMQLTFPLNVEAVLVALVNLPGWIILLLRGRTGGTAA